MSGHSKWATIKRSKAANDAKRGNLFTKLGHEIALAAREGGPEPEANFRLRIALDKARQANMPKDNIERAIKRGTGQSDDAVSLEEILYEGYGPHGIAVLVKALTDNRNRTVSEIRHVFTRYGGNLGAGGSVAWMFSRKGYLSIGSGEVDPEEIALQAIDAGAEDVEIGDDTVEIYTAVEDLSTVRGALEEAGLEIGDAQLSWIPQSTTQLSDSETLKSMKLLEALEELMDVQEVFSNLDIQDEMIARYESEAA
ncbi:MAG: YebC/PmpR family DNA-binding transcriptional regulator [Anaerolineae bacterium]|nr:YebC/PmpR family DNA-binding transcriptional regulator [Anaerolineae bacterium]